MQKERERVKGREGVQREKKSENLPFSFVYRVSKDFGPFNLLSTWLLFGYHLKSMA